MEFIFVEFLSELKISLEEIEKSLWYKWMEKSCEEYKATNDVTYFLNAFGGYGSFSDADLTSEITAVLQHILYDIAIELKKQGNFDLVNILQEEKNFLIESLNHMENLVYIYKKEQRMEMYKNELDYVNYLINNYIIGNLHQLTNEYLKQKKLITERKDVIKI